MYQSKLIAGAILSGICLSSTAIYASDYREDKRQDHRQDNRQDHRQNVRQFKRTVNASRVFRNVIVVRPYGHRYIGYGNFHNDNDAYKWLAFTAITLKILDNINEEAQRKHEAAQISATTATIGQKVIWQTPSASGYVVATKQGATPEGLNCREFQQSITVSGKVEKAFGTACLQADGAWKII